MSERICDKCGNESINGLMAHKAGCEAQRLWSVSPTTAPPLYIKPDYSVTFSNSEKQVGKLDFNGPKMMFEGDAEESARIFFEWIAKSFEDRLKEERGKGAAEKTE